MDKLVIKGGAPLSGEVRVSGAKNAALPILFSSLLTDEPCTYRRVPRLEDISTTIKLMENMGVKIVNDLQNHRLITHAGDQIICEAPYDYVRRMRASTLVLGPLLARFGRAMVSLPGGCAIGARPIDIHLKGLQEMGAEIHLVKGYVVASAERLRGARITLDFPSVGATENLLMAAVLAEGSTVLTCAACEPEIVDLAQALQAMGAKISGAGTPTIEVEGVPKLHGCEHSVLEDRIEAGTYLCAAFASGGEVIVRGLDPVHLESVLSVLERAGARIERGEDSIVLKKSGRPQGVDFSTEPFPGFPTDMQAQMMAVLCLAQGKSVITETVFENRFMHVLELARLGAMIQTKDRSAIISGVERMSAAPMMATDLRASASLVIAALAAQGETEIRRIYHLDRGYEDMLQKLQSLGAEIRRVRDE